MPANDRWDLVWRLNGKEKCGKCMKILLECWGGGGLCGVWNEKVRLIHKIDKVRYLLYDEVVCSVDGIMTGCQFMSFCAIQGWSRISYFFLFSALYYIMWHALVWYTPYSTLLWFHGSLFGGGARIFIYQLIFRSAIIHCWHTSDSLWLFKIFVGTKNIIFVVKLAKNKIRGFCL
jgi:hypothetical protein